MHSIQSCRFHIHQLFTHLHLLKGRRERRFLRYVHHYGQLIKLSDFNRLTPQNHQPTIEHITIEQLFKSVVLSIAKHQVGSR